MKGLKMETKFWYKDGLLHREDGPAVEHPGGKLEYWLNGRKCKSLKDFETRRQYKDKKVHLKVLIDEQTHSKLKAYCALRTLSIKEVVTELIINKFDGQKN